MMMWLSVRVSLVLVFFVSGVLSARSEVVQVVEWYVYALMFSGVGLVFSFLSIKGSKRKPAIKEIWVERPYPTSFGGFLLVHHLSVVQFGLFLGLIVGSFIFGNNHSSYAFLVFLVFVALRFALMASSIPFKKRDEN